MDIPFDLLNIVSSYLVIPKMKLLDWIDIKMLEWETLSLNPNVPYDMLKQNVKKISSINICKNPSNAAMRIIVENMNLIDWYNLSQNPNTCIINTVLEPNLIKVKIRGLSCNSNDDAIKILERNIRKTNDSEKRDRIMKYIDWYYLSANPSDIAIDILEQNTDMIDWNGLSNNPNKRAIQILEANYEKINWSYLSGNPSATHLLESVLQQDSSKINLHYLSLNPNFSVIYNLLEKNMNNPLASINWLSLSCNPNANVINTFIEPNLDKLDLQCQEKRFRYWIHLSGNPNAIHILEAHRHKIYWYYLSQNPSIFEIDKTQYKIDITNKANILDKLL